MRYFVPPVVTLERTPRIASRKTWCMGATIIMGSRMKHKVTRPEIFHFSSTSVQKPCVFPIYWLVENGIPVIVPNILVSIL